MQPTHLLYLEDFNLLRSPAKIIDIIKEGDKTIIVLDQTIFYPQGGGQVYDTGIIENESGSFLVEEVRFVDGIVKHMGRFTGGHFAMGDNVVCAVDKERRELNSRLHSAGHVVDMAVASFGYDWTPGKGYHFPDGPYVEYTGSLPSDKDAIKQAIEAKANEFVKENRSTRLLFMDREAMKKVCRFVPDYLPANKPSRVVMYGDFGVPCGGTHVNNLGAIGPIVIRKIRTEGQTIRISYEISK